MADIILLSIGMNLYLKDFGPAQAEVRQGMYMNVARQRKLYPVMDRVTMFKKRL